MDDASEAINWSAIAQQAFRRCAGTASDRRQRSLLLPVAGGRNAAAEPAETASTARGTRKKAAAEATSEPTSRPATTRRRNA
jgi:hypothetical protein